MWNDDVKQGPAVPVGLPVNCVVRVKPEKGLGSSGASVDGTTLRLGSGNDEIFRFPSIFDQNSTNADIHQKLMALMLSKMVSGYNVGLLVWGPSGSGRSHTVDGDLGKNNGLIPMAVTELFSLMTQKMGKHASGGAGGGRYDQSRATFSVSVQYFEVYNDVLHNLLDPTEAGPDLDVVMREYGYEADVHAVEVRHPNEFHELFAKAQENRVHTNSDFGPLRDRASTFLVVDLLQTLPQGPHVDRLFSRLLVCTLPSSHLLVEDVQTLRIREGPRLNNELLALASLVQTLSDPNRNADFASYRSSKTTTLLDDALGGNCLTLCLATAKLSDLASTRVTLQYAERLATVHNFPIKNDERAVGLLRRLRLQIDSLEVELENYEAMGGPSQAKAQAANSATTESAVLDLKQRLLKSEYQRSKLFKEKKDLYDKYSKFREQYKALVKSKAEVQSELIQSEEERLVINKRLIDLQIENTDLREQTLSEKHELEAKLLSVENEKVERDMMEQKHREQNEQLQQQLEQLITEKKELSIEYVTLRQNFQNMRQDLDKQLTKNQDVGAELLHLVNTKDVLEENAEKLKAENESLRAKNKELTQFKADADEKQAALIREVTELKAHNERLKLESVRKEVELSKAVTEFESQKTTVEKNYMNMAMEKDAEVTALRQAVDKHQAKLTELKTKHEKEMALKYKEFKLIQRQNAQLEAQLSELNDEGTELRTQVNTLKQQLAHESETYRAKLAQYMTQMQQHLADLTEAVEKQTADDDDAADAKDDDADDAAIAAEMAAAQAEEPMRAQIDKMYQDLLSTHNARENELQTECDRQRTKYSKLLRVNRQLAAQYRSLRSVVTDLAPPGSEFPLLDEKELQALIQGPDTTEERQKVEVQLLRDQVQELRTEVDNSKQLLLQQAESHQIATANLQKAHIHLKDEYEALSRAHANCGKGVDKSVMDEHKAALQQLQETLEKKFVAQLDSLHERSLAIEPQHSPLREELYALRDKMEALRKENEQLRRHGGNSAEFAAKEREYKDKIAELEADVRKAKKKPDTQSIRKELKEFTINTQKRLERERARLKSRLTRKEQELAHYESYMKTELMKHQKEILRLRKEVVYWKQAAQKYGAPVSTMNPAQQAQNDPPSAWR